MFFNISHASIIASNDHCEHESVNEYIGEMTQSQECDDLCDIHHLFHVVAIITPVIIFPTDDHDKTQPDTTLLRYHPTFKETAKKPPIA
jgi:hypothetical protein